MAALLNHPYLRPAIVRRVLAIVPSRSWKIELLHFNFVPDPVSSDTLLIRYRFKNALWYIVDDTVTCENCHTVVRPDDDGEKLIMLTAQGLFRKNVYLITIRNGKAHIMEIRA